MLYRFAYLKMKNENVLKADIRMKHKDLYFLYLHDKIKIGVSQDVDIRINRILTTGGYKRKDILKIVTLKSKGYLEVLIHRKLKQSKINGEWFYNTRILSIFLHQIKSMEEHEYIDARDLEKAYRYAVLIGQVKTIVRPLIEERTS